MLGAASLWSGVFRHVAPGVFGLRAFRLSRMIESFVQNAGEAGNDHSLRPRFLKSLHARRRCGSARQHVVD